MKTKFTSPFPRAAIMLLLMLLTSMTALAQVTYNATAGTDGANSNEGYAKLFDGDTKTKWCVTSLGNPTYVEFSTSAAVKPQGYMLTTGADTKSNKGRNPKNWVLKAKVNSNDTEWATLHTVENDNRMSTENETGTSYAFSNSTDYQYFRLEISAIQNGSTFQLSEFRFLTDDEVADVLVDLSQVSFAGLQSQYKYTGSAINISYTVKNLLGETIAPSKYTATIRNSNNDVVTEVVDNDTYTLTITPDDNTYHGEKSVTFDVIPWDVAGIGGYCGDPAVNDGKNVYYEITEDAQHDKTLTIKGSGAMADYETGEAPWYSSRAGIKYVVVDNNITHIGSSTFDRFDMLSDITISKDVTTIGDYAFYSCNMLTNITIPNGVTSIGKNVFANCNHVASVAIGSGLTTIGSGAFHGCDALTSFTVDENNTAFKAINNVLFSEDEKTLVVYPPGLAATDYTIPDGVTTISDYAFYYCQNLTNIAIPASATTIGDYAFAGTAWIGNQGYTDGVLYINNVAIASSDDQEVMTIKPGTTAIAGGAFVSRYKLTSVTIPASVTYIGQEAFRDCSRLTLVNIESGSQLTTIGDAAFSRCNNLASITIPASVTTIGDEAFYYCQKLTSVTIPAGVTAIGNGAFMNCAMLSQVNVVDGSLLTSFGDKAFRKCSLLTSITIPAGVTTIGNEAFRMCTSLADVYCDADPTQLTWGNGNSDFMSNRATVCHVENAADWNGFEANVHVTFVGGYCGNTTANDGKNLRWDVASDGSNLTLSIFKNPAAVGDDFSMAANADFGSANIKTVIIENGVTSIGANAFKDRSNLNAVVVLDTTPPALGGNAFSGINNNAVFTVRNDDYLTADGWKDVKDHTGDYSYEGCAFTMTIPDAGNFDIAYIDANGQPAVCPLAIPITSSNANVTISNSGDTWYYVSGNVAIDGKLYFSAKSGSTNLILCDGASLEVNSLEARNNLNIYSQSDDNTVGAIAVAHSVNYNGIYSYKNLTINGGNITINGIGSNKNPIASNKITINGGSINVSNYQKGLSALMYQINGGTLTISDSNNGLTINTQTASISPYINISGGTINIKSVYFGIRNESGDINISGGTINIEGASFSIQNDKGNINISGGTITVASAINEGINAHGGNVGIQNATVNITCTSNDFSNVGILVSDHLTISNSTVDVTVSTSNNYTEGIWAKNITITDATVKASAISNNSDGFGLYADNTVTINSGTVTAYGYSFGVKAGNIILGRGRFGDYVYSNSYSGTVNIKDGQSFKYDDGTEYVTVSGDNVDKDAIAGKYLFPVVNDITLKANSDGNGSYWATFYCGHTSYTADGSTEIFKGAVNGNSVQLATVDDIPAGKAAILKSTASPIVLTLTTTASGDFTENDLKGTDTEIVPPANTYCMAKGASGVGFYQYSATYGNIPANRAYLIIPGSTSASQFFGFDETTSVADVRSKMSDVRGDYYDLQGRKVAEPTNACHTSTFRLKKGLYIVNGKKVFIK